MPGNQPEPLLRVAVGRTGDTVTVWLDGELDCASAVDVDAAVEQAFAGSAPIRRVIVDAARLSFVDVAGLRPLLELRQRLATASMQIRNPPQAVVRVVQLLDLAEVLGLDC